jgi:Co/Zn/Cd efflux system component
MRDHDMHGSHSHAKAPSWLFWLGIFINFSFFIADVIVWQISGSVAILADSTHNLFHAIIYALALWGNTSFNQHRQARASFWIGAIILGTALFLCALGGYRIANPVKVSSIYMIFMASLDIVFDILLISLIFTVTHHSIRVYKMYLVRNVLKDIIIDNLASVGVIIGGVSILATQFYRADGIATIPIAGIAAILGWQIIREARRELTNGA